jgi:hypothetical protein
MRVATLLMVGALVTGSTSESAAQSLAYHFDAPPILEPGRKVRVWTWEPSPVPSPVVQFSSRLEPRFRVHHIVGTVVDYQPPDSLSLRRTSLVVTPWAGRSYTVRWEEIHRIEVPDGHQGPWWGLGAGVGAAISVGFTVVFMERLVSWDTPRLPRGHNLPTYSARAAIVTVPLGVVVGLISTRWRRIY